MAKRVDINDFAAMAEFVFGRTELNRKELGILKERYDVLCPMGVLDNKVGRGIFRIPGDPEKGSCPEETAIVPDMTENSSPAPAATPSSNSTFSNLSSESFNGVKVFSAPMEHSLVPLPDTNFVAWGNYSTIKKLLQAQMFMSIYVVGETGNGKTMNFEQAAAELNRELVKVNFTNMTDEDDLIGGFRLINGETVWVDGPVIEAMKRGAILLLDEVDLATEPVMALQSVLQGKSHFIKKLGRVVSPAPGFMIVATANTKGDGDGDYMFTNVLNKAFLDRFKVLLEQPYPDENTERRILLKFMKNNCPDIPESWADDAVRFAENIRASYKEGSLSDQISTRRLVDMTSMYQLIGNEEEAIRLTTNRFDGEVQDAMLKLWDIIRTERNKEELEDDGIPLHDVPVDAPTPSNRIPF